MKHEGRHPGPPADKGVNKDAYLIVDVVFKDDVIEVSLRIFFGSDKFAASPSQGGWWGGDEPSFQFTQR